MMKMRIQRAAFSFLLGAFAPISVYAAANFTIVPDANFDFPTSAFPEETVVAYYTVTNNTSSPVTGFSVQGLPHNVRQVTKSAVYCPSNITLNPGQSCVLQLAIRGSAQTQFAICSPFGDCTSPEIPIAVFDTPFLAPAAAVGQYEIDAMYTTAPILLASHDAGNTWVYAIYSNIAGQLSDYGSNGSFSGVYCTRSTCIADGSYKSSNAGNCIAPLLVTSHDRGFNWDYTITSQKPTLSSTYAALTTAACNAGRTCVAAGKLNAGAPLVATSQDLGTTWQYTLTDTVNPITYVTPTSINNSVCSGAYCFIGGYQGPISNQLPLLLISSNYGSSWTTLIPNLATMQGYVSDYANRGAFSQVSASGLIAVAVGRYFTSTPTAYPLAGVSKDAGATWDFKIYSNISTVVTDFKNNGIFNSVSCNPFTCVTVGGYQTTAMSNNNAPLAAVSVNGGNTWNYTITSGTFNVISDYASTIGLNSVSCSSMVCVAGGSYVAKVSGKTYPVIARSTDGGFTWSFPLTSDAAGEITNYLDNGVINTVSCNGVSCVASGTFKNASAITLPFIFTSSNGGLTWALTVNGASKPTAPEDAYGDFLVNASLSTN